MDQDALYREPLHPLTQHIPSHVPTVLVCHNNLIRSGINHVLSGTRFVVSAATDDQPLVDPTLCLIYADQVANDACESVDRLRMQWPSVRTVLLSDHLDPAAVVRAFQAGLDGLCATAMSHNALILALELVMRGEKFIPADVALALLNAQPKRHDVGFGSPAAPMHAEDGLSRKSLSGREAQVLHLLTQGASNKVIARDLGLTEATVKVHVKAVLRKVKASNRTQAAVWAQHQMTVDLYDGNSIAAK
jgi:two-component system nitrate/nitrite response regulator NarL